MTITTPCQGCKFLAMKWRGIFPRWICGRYRLPALVRCLDWSK
jgi:hypothetical protein